MRILLAFMAFLSTAPLWGAAPAFTPCDLPGIEEKLNCTVVEVFENRTTPGRKIPIHVAVLKATSGQSSDDPIFALAGGPGQAATDLIDFVPERFASLRASRDIVFVDIRGTGKSNGLFCNLYGTEIQDYFGDLFPVEATKQCLIEMEKHADLKQYNTLEIVHDLEEVRKTLGYGKLNLYGTSYGTRVALVYMRQYPDSIRSVILHGTAPTNLKAPLYHAWAGQQSLDDIFAKCAADAACNSAFPNIRKELDLVLKKLDQSELFELTDPVSKKQVKLPMTRGVFGEALRNMLYNAQSAGRVPLLIHKASKGDYQAFAEFNYMRRKMAQEHLAVGVFHSVSCAEDVPLITNEEIEKETKGAFLQDYRIRQQQQVCKIWPRASMPPQYNDPVRSNITTLLVTGELDPVTPLRIANQAAEHLSNSKTLVVRGGGHSDGSACLDTLMASFIQDPDPKRISDSCLSKETTPLSFELP